jgi:hypothetical protein
MNGERLSKTNLKHSLACKKMLIERNKEVMKSYGQQLESEVFNKYRKSQDSVNAEKRLEMQLALQKKAELDQMNAIILDKKKQTQATLSNEYENAMKMRDHQKNYDKYSDLQTGQVANLKAMQDLNFLNQSELNKRSMIKDILTNHKSQHDGAMDQTEKDRYAITLEDKRHLSEQERRQQDRDLGILSKYNQFNEFQNKNAISYNSQVIKPKMEKDMMMNQLIKKQEMDSKRKASMDEERCNTMKRDWAMENRFGLEKQMKNKNDNGQVFVAEHNYDQHNSRSIERDYYNLKNQDLMEKKERQILYKKMLDTQKNTKATMKMYGNMTGIEKQLNKNDLSAFKNYDSKTYALIPGMNSITNSPSKKIMEEKFSKKQGRTHEDENNRMNQFGLTRDVTLMKNPGLMYNAHIPSNAEITGHSQHSKQGYERSTTVSRPPSIAMPTPTKGNMTVNNFNNHHLYQSYNPISGVYNPDKQALNQNRSTFRYAAARNLAQ